MTRRVTLGLAVVILIITSVLLVLKHRAPQTTATSPTAKAVPAGPAARPEQAARTAAPTQPEVPVTVPTTNLTGLIDPAKRAEVTTVLAELKSLYGDVGTLSWDETKALVAKRQKAAKDLVDRLAKLGPGGARAIADAYAEAGDTRAKLLLVAALGRIGDGEAAAVLDSLLKRDDSFSLKKEIVAALGQRQEPTAGAVLSDILQTQDDARLRAVSVQALSAHVEALPLLAEHIRTDADPNVRLEAIRSVGLIGTDEARNVLAGVAQSSMPLAERQSAIQELGRVFGASALGVFDKLLADPDEAIRNNAVSAVARVKTDAAIALLQRTAASDTSEQVRQRAQAALPPAP